MTTPERAICEILRDELPVGLGFAVGRSRIMTCAHVVNRATGRPLRDSTDPGDAEVSIRFTIGQPTKAVTYQASVLGWLPTSVETFDGNDLALLDVENPLPNGIPELSRIRHAPSMTVQMWGPQLSRQDGGHVLGTLMGEVPGGRIQINSHGGPFRVRQGFSGGPVWLPSTHDVVGVVAACGVGDEAADAYMLDVDRMTAFEPGLRKDFGVRSWLGQDRRDSLLEGRRALESFLAAKTRGTWRFGQEHYVVWPTAKAVRYRYLLKTFDSAVGPAELDGARSLLRQYRAAGLPTAGIYVVYEGVPAGEATTTKAESIGISLWSIGELQEALTAAHLRRRRETYVRELPSDQSGRPKKLVGGLAAILGACACLTALGVTAWQQLPSSFSGASPNTPPSPSTSAEPIRICLVTDINGIEAPLTLAAYGGINDAQRKRPEFEARFVTSVAPEEYLPNVDNSVRASCQLVVTVGNGMEQVTIEVAQKYPAVRFVILNSSISGSNITSVASTNPDVIRRAVADAASLVR